MATYVGQRKRATALLTVNDLPADGTVTWRIMRPDGTEATPDESHPALGTYLADFTVTDEGPWFVRFVSTGATAAAAETTVYVEDSPFY